MAESRPHTLLKKGAEADIYRADGTVLKVRAQKNYRIKPLDEKLRRERTRAEAKLLLRAAPLINVPKVLSNDNFSICMEFVCGKRVKDAITAKNYLFICKKIGAMAARLHSANIIHGDMTTSNMIIQNSEIYFIDFGLGFFSHSVEDMAVDLRLLEEAFISTHPDIAQDAIAAILKSYEKSGGKKEVLLRLEKIRARGRYAKR